MIRGARGFFTGLSPETGGPEVSTTLHAGRSGACGTEDFQEEVDCRPYGQGEIHQPGTESTVGVELGAGSTGCTQRE